MKFVSAATRTNPLEVKANHITYKNTFLKYKRKNTAKDFTENKLVYKIIKTKRDTFNYMFFGNAYKLGFIDENNNVIKNAVVLQDNIGELYLVPVNLNMGRKPKVTKSWLRFEYRTMLHYVPKLNAIIDIDEENEVLFTINPELEEFIAVGEGIEGEKIKGYKLQFVRKLKDIKVIKEEPISLDELENEDYKFDDNVKEDANVGIVGTALSADDYNKELADEEDNDILDELLG